MAAAYHAPDVQVQRNVKLPSIRRRGGIGGGREIDVLLTGSLAGQVVHFPIECKDYKTSVPIAAVEAFRTKLEDVGADKGIMVSSRGFQQGAIETARAQKPWSRAIEIV